MSHSCNFMPHRDLKIYLIVILQELINPYTIFHKKNDQHRNDKVTSKIIILAWFIKVLTNDMHFAQLTGFRLTNKKLLKTIFFYYY